MSKDLNYVSFLAYVWMHGETVIRVVRIVLNMIMRLMNVVWSDVEIFDVNI